MNHPDKITVAGSGMKNRYRTIIPSKSSVNPMLTFPKQALIFTCLQYKSFENTVGKGEIARHEQFLPQWFIPI